MHVINIMTLCTYTYRYKHVCTYVVECNVRSGFSLTRAFESFGLSTLLFRLFGQDTRRRTNNTPDNVYPASPPLYRQLIICNRWCCRWPRDETIPPAVDRRASLLPAIYRWFAIDDVHSSRLLLLLLLWSFILPFLYQLHLCRNAHSAILVIGSYVSAELSRFALIIYRFA